MVQSVCRMNKVVLLLAAVISVCLGCNDNNSGDDTDIDGLEISATQCQDGEDNDGDNLNDCKDPDCMGFIFCVDGGTADGDSDSDGDGDSDSDVDSDSDTDSDSDSDRTGIDGLEISASQCQDSDDNDDDGLTDCEDDDCQGFVFCVDAGTDGCSAQLSCPCLGSEIG